MNTQVFVYRNLHYRDRVMFSLKAVKTNRVIGHSECIHLVGVKLKVSQAGRQRVIRERKKNVHAGVVGTLHVITPQAWEVLKDEPWEKVRYNPYQTETFVDMSGAPVLTAREALICSEGVLILR